MSPLSASVVAVERVGGRLAGGEAARVVERRERADEQRASRRACRLSLRVQGPRDLDEGLADLRPGDRQRRSGSTAKRPERTQPAGASRPLGARSWASVRLLSRRGEVDVGVELQQALDRERPLLRARSATLFPWAERDQIAEQGAAWRSSRSRRCRRTRSRAACRRPPERPLRASPRSAPSAAVPGPAGR